MAVIQNQTSYAGSPDNDSISGTAGVDSLAGAAGNDTFQGSAGNDLLLGGDGQDTAKYSGNQSGYRVQASAVTGQVTVTDIDSTDGNEGTDTLQGIEQLEFADGAVAIASQTAADGQINSYFDSAQRTASMTPLTNGDYLTVWESNGQDGSGWGIYAQRFSASGAKMGSEFRLNTTPSGNQWLAEGDENQAQSVAATADGGFIATWASDNSDGSSWGIVAQRFDAAGHALGRS